MSLRKTIADSRWLMRTVTACLAGYVRFAHATSRWERVGFEAMDEAVAAGEPVIMVLWHQRLTMGGYLFDTRRGPVCSLTSAARAGRTAAGMLQRFGYQNIAMQSRQRHVALSREVLRRMKEGVSIAIAADGPRGPERVSSTVPLVWARSSGKRVFITSFSANRVGEMNTWDRMWLPKPFSRGVLMCREWDQTVPRKASEEEVEALRLDLEAAMNALTADSDRHVGREVSWPG